MTKIEWVKGADGAQGKTWNPLAGCSIVSPGCRRCYAMRMAARLEAMGVPHYAGLTQPSKAGPVWTGKMALAPDHIFAEPFHRKKPTMYFVNSMSDLFHEDVPDEWIDRVFVSIALAPHHTFQILTKRAVRMRAYMTASGKGKVAREGSAMERVRETHHWARFDNAPGWKGWPLPNVWLGVSAEDQTRADERIPDLLATPAAVRFVSAEPLLGALKIAQYLEPDEEHGIDFSRSPGSMVGGCIGVRPPLDWVIVGGESGAGARPMQPAWARSIRDQCAAAGVPYFFKQWGSHAPASVVLPNDHLEQDADIMCKTSKARAGRLLDGREWNGMPEAAA